MKVHDYQNSTLLFKDLMQQIFEMSYIQFISVIWTVCYLPVLRQTCHILLIQYDWNDGIRIALLWYSEEFPDITYHYGL